MNITNNELQNCIGQVEILAEHGDNTARIKVQGGSNMTGTDLCVNKPHCAAAVRP